VADPNTLDLEQLPKFAEPTIQATATELHEMLDVVQHRKEGIGELEELIQGVGHFPSGEQPEEVAEVVATVEGDPLDIVVQHDPGRHHQLGEAGGIDPLGRKAVEVDAAAAEQVDSELAIIRSFYY